MSRIVLTSGVINDVVLCKANSLIFNKRNYTLLWECRYANGIGFLKKGEETAC
jgi:hypothetical protein